MTNSLFVTGSSGFIGRNFLNQLEHNKYDKIVCLTRNPSLLTQYISEIQNLEIVKSDLLDWKKYEDKLKKCNMVIHFAALTGKHKPEAYFRVNTKGTQLLIDNCKQSGIRNFLYISSIAAKFSDKHRYYYAQSKFQAEEMVKKSGLDYIIVRPTQVLGKDGSLWKNFSQLAKAPFAFIFGNGQTKIQPIFVNDLVDCLLKIIDEEQFAKETIELGGREILTIEDFIKRIHQFHYNKKPRVIHIPLKLVIPVLSLFEQFLYNFLPITVGQLAAFNNDGIILENRIFKNLCSQMKNADEIIRVSANSGEI